MTLCILTSSYPCQPKQSINSGVFVRDFAKACSSLVPSCFVYTHRKGRLGDYRENFPVVEYSWLGAEDSLTSLNLSSPLGFLKAASLIAMGSIGYLRECKTRDVSHSLAMWAFPSGFYALLGKKLYGIPYTVWALGSDIWRYEKHPLIGPLLRRILSEADYLFADGLELAERVSTLCSCDCNFLPSTRDLSYLKVSELSDDREHPRFLFVGRYENNKGPDILLEATKIYLDKGGVGSFNLFGQGALRSQLDDYISRHDLFPRVLIDDAINTADLVTRLHWCDYLVIPSRIESIPVILSDALQMGVPVVATEVGDLGKMVREMGAGLVVPPEDPEQLADAMLVLDTSTLTNLVASLGLRPPLTHPTESARKFLQAAGLLSPKDRKTGDIL